MKLFIIILCMLLACGFIAAKNNCEGTNLQLSFGPGVAKTGYYDFSDNKSGRFAGIGMGIERSSHLEILLKYEKYWKRDNVRIYVQSVGDYSQIDMFSIEARVFLYDLNHVLRPFLSIAAGIAETGLKLDYHDMWQHGYYADGKRKFLQFGGGLEWRITRRIRPFVKGLYTNFRNGEHFSLDSFNVTAGLAFTFFIVPDKN